MNARANGIYFAPPVGKEMPMLLRYAAGILALVSSLTAEAGFMTLDTPATCAVWLNISDDFYNQRQNECNLRVFAFNCGSHQEK
jgi:hypothetical protein